MALLTPQGPATTGAAVTPVAAAVGGDTYRNTGREVLEVTNGAGSGSITVTISSQAACDYGVSNAAHDKTGSVGFGTTKRFGPYDAKFNDADGLIHVGYSGVTTITVAVTRNP